MLGRCVHLARATSSRVTVPVPVPIRAITPSVTTTPTPFCISSHAPRISVFNTSSRSRDLSFSPFSSSAESDAPSTSTSPTSSQRASFTAADIRRMKAYIIDMDGVLYWEQKLIPGALEFIDWLKANNKKFVFLTNSSERSPRELQEKLARLNIRVNSSHFYTSALATASFLARQRPNGSAYVIGEPGLISALYDAGYSMNDSNPDYVVVGETKSYNYSMLETAVRLIRRGARLIGTNCDIADRTNDSFIPACGSLTKPIELASGRTAYYIGKPNPIIMRAALTKLGTDPNETCIIGDRLDTDILAGIQTELRTVLLLTGVTSIPDVSLCAYRPDCILPSLGHILLDGHEVTESNRQSAAPTSSAPPTQSPYASSASPASVPTPSSVPSHNINHSVQETPHQ